MNHMSGRGFVAILLLCVPLVACTGELTPTGGDVTGDGDGDGDLTPEEEAFANMALPAIQAGACLGCHIMGGSGGNLFDAAGSERMAILANMTPVGGEPIITSPAADSVLVVYGDHTDPAMNPSGLAGGREFTPDEVTAITGWIQMEIDAGNVAP